jgi:hypothetical protein
MTNQGHAKRELTLAGIQGEAFTFCMKVVEFFDRLLQEEFPVYQKKLDLFRTYGAASKDQRPLGGDLRELYKLLDRTLAQEPGLQPTTLVDNALLLVQQQILSPLQGTEDEWEFLSDFETIRLFQNVRDRRVFKKVGVDSMEHLQLSARLFRQSNGAVYSRGDRSNRTIDSFPYTPYVEYVEVDDIDNLQDDQLESALVVDGDVPVEQELSS